MRNSVSMALALAACLSLFAAGARHDALLQTSRAWRLPPGRTADGLEGASPMVTFTAVVLGGFRGLIADVLWLRATLLQEEGRYVELVQLADWVTKLEPTAKEVWGFHAWNIAYNVSVMMVEPEDRWRWVQNGIRLLRDEGLRYNPRDAGLYWELGWLFQNKIGAPLDDAAPYYRNRWALAMQAALGAGGPGLEGVGEEAERRLRDDYRLSLAVMRQVDALYGPLDWRLPEPHAVYWAFLGRTRSDARHALALDRMIYQSMAALVAGGKLDFRPDEGLYRTSADLTLIPGAVRAYEEALARHSDRDIAEAYGFFLRDAAQRLRAAGREAEAGNLERLRAGRTAAASDGSEEGRP